MELYDVMRTTPAVREDPHAITLPPASGGVTFSNITFGYDRQRPVLRDISLHIQPGETVACVGPTGAGKSTLAKLIARLYDPQEGRVLIDGEDVKDFTLKSLRYRLPAASFSVTRSSARTFLPLARERSIFGIASCTLFSPKSR